MFFSRSKLCIKSIGSAAFCAIGGLCASCAIHEPVPVDSELRLEGAAIPSGQISEADRAMAWARIDENLARIGPLPATKAGVNLRWPLRAARGLAAEWLHYVGDLPDHDPGPGVLDYNCGSRTRQREDHVHSGTDFYVWAGNRWDLMARDQVEVVAAAAGIVVERNDGMFDRNCVGFAGEGQQGNYVYVRHDDGSFAWYVHLKAGSLTAKGVGERVETGEFLGVVGSSGSSGAPHLHLQVYDANRRIADPYQGACNDWNADSWWAEQRPYFDPAVNRVMTASSPGTSPVCGPDGRISDPGVLRSATAFKPGDDVYAIAYVRDARPGDSLSFSVRRPDGSTYVDRVGNIDSAGFVQDSRGLGARWTNRFTLGTEQPAGTWMVDVGLAGTIARTSFEVTADGLPSANYTDLWWNPVESGWGVNLNHQADILFATWFTYDADGSPMWLVMSDARKQPDGSFGGTIYRATGVPFTQIDGRPAANFPIPAVGTGSFRFASAGHGTFSYTVGNVTQQKSIERQRFSTPGTCRATQGSRSALTNYQDLWWNAPETGWGINLTHQGEIIFATWFTYGANGQGLWLVGSDVRRQPTGDFRGRLYRTHGVPFDRVSGAPAIISYTDVGELVLRFISGEAATMTYTVDGITQTRAITRQVFQNLVNHCE